MTQSEINEKEWNDPNNWSDNFWGLYFSKKDSRIWVPKKNKNMGWTLNLATKMGVNILFIFTLIIPMFFLIIMTIVIRMKN